MSDNSLKKGRYTKYSNKIGLFSNSRGSFIKNDTEVVLNFPFKDAVLEGGMSKEDTGRDERFLQVEIDSKDIDTLEEPKVLTDFRYIDKDGERAITASDDIDFFDNNGELKQNLLIKGNNLLALFTLKARIAGKVKLIYLDPPYNTGNDGFRYNDSFNHSAWLTFMKNRLEVAKDLLADDGVIFVQCDDNEQAYLKVLMDEVFTRDNFVKTIHVQMSIVQGEKVRAAKGGNIVKNGEYIHVYSASGNRAIGITPLYDPSEYDTHYSTYINDDSTEVPLTDFVCQNTEICELLELAGLMKNNKLSIDNLARAYNQITRFRQFIHDNASKIARVHTMIEGL